MSISRGQPRRRPGGEVLHLQEIAQVRPTHAPATDQAEHNPISGPLPLGHEARVKAETQADAARERAGLAEKLSPGLHNFPVD
jgi:hypothetical protein